MPAILNWLLRLVLTNPICMRLVQGGSRRPRHMLIRSGYLAVMIVMVAVMLLGNISGSPTVRQLARAGAQTFTWVSYLQVGLICLLTPVFMAGAIAQEANPRTWDILLTTPLGNMQIVLGNLFGRLFFILALLFSTLPLFAVTQYFGGVPGKSIFASYAIAGCSSLLVAAVAITLCVNRTAGKRAVFWFYALVVMYLFITYAIDLRLRVPVGPAVAGRHTTLLTPLNPFLALEVLLQSNTYVPHDFTGERVATVTRLWLGQPIAAFCWLCVLTSLALIVYSTTRVRVIGARTGTVPWHRRLLGLSAKGAVERPARRVGNNPIAWRESVARGKTLVAMLTRWSFVGLGIVVGLVLIVMHRTGLWTAGQLQMALITVLAAEIVVIVLVAINMSATAVSREREDGTLDIILTTPIQPGPYLSGKLRGIFQYLVPMMAVPAVTAMMAALYVTTDGLGHGDVLVRTTIAGQTGTKLLPLMLPEGAFAIPIVLLPFIAFCVMVGLHWSIKSKGTISSVVGAVIMVGGAAGLLGICSFTGGKQAPMIGAAFAAMSPVNLLWAMVYPGDMIPQSLNDRAALTVTIIVGALVVAVAYALIVYAMHTNMKRGFMMTVRKLAGTN